jgi:hypothetical protein
MKKILAAVTAVALSFAMVALPSIAASADQPDFICPSYAPSGTDKINTSGDPATVPYTAPSGYLVDYYCVKAGTEHYIVDVVPPAASITIDHPTKDSVSHYSVHWITAPTDVCDNIDGVQATIPDGMVQSANGTSCETPPTDVCDNIDGVQATIPDGMVQSANGTSCETPPTDVCDNIDGVQTTIPDGMVQSTNGTSCETPDDGCDELIGGPGFSISVDIDCPDLPLEVSGKATHQTCEASGDESVGDFVDGSILLTVSDLDGVTKIEYKKDGGSLVNVPLNDLTIDGLEPGSYEFFVTVADGYQAVANFTVEVNQTQDPECKKQTICHWNEGGKGELGSYVEIDVSIKSIINVPNGHDTHEFDIIPPFDYYDGDVLKSYEGKNYNPEAEGCGDYQFPTEGPVTPEVLFTPATCDTDGSYTLTAPPLTEGVPADAVTFFVNDVETEPGTYPVEVGEVITVKVVANYEDFPLDLSLPGGFVAEYTYPAYEFTAPTACDLTTLALTGSSDTTPTLALTAFLGLLGLAMVRSGIRVNRVRQES